MEKLLNCKLCPRNCNINRDTRSGVCRADNNIRIAYYGLHFWEEPIISGKSGSGAIFFSGCQLKCVYCQNYIVSHHLLGYDISCQDLANIFIELENKGAHNINLISPTPYIEQIINALKIYTPKIPIIYNSGGYEKIESIEKILPYVKIFIPDFKYTDCLLAEKYSSAKDYCEVAENFIDYLVHNVKNIFHNNTMQSGIIIRHLVLPNNLNNTKKFLDIYSRKYKDVYLSLMSQFTPCGDCKKQPELNFKLKPLEYKIAVSYAEKLGLEKVFIQSLTSASEEYIPPFKGEPLF